MSETSDYSGRPQNVRNFTVKVCSSDFRDVFGTGVLVSASGLVATCAHVVSGNPDCNRVEVGTEVGIRLRRRPGRTEALRARVFRVLPDGDDDLVLLQIDGCPHFSEDEVAVLGDADGSENHLFSSWGFQELERYEGARAYGTILGTVDPPEGYRLRVDPVQLESKEIDKGMSGAAVLDTQRNLVVGLVMETCLPTPTGKHGDTAWAVDARLLASPPFGLAVRDDCLPRVPVRQPEPGVAEVRRGRDTLGIDLHDAPALPPEWVDRPALLATLDGDRASPEIRITSLVGLVGSGKSSLVRKWVEELWRSASPPVGVFWWSFGARPSVDAFLESALRFLSGNRINPELLPGSSARLQVIAAMMGTSPVVLVLDGLDALQNPGGDDRGELLSASLRELLGLIAETPHPSFCVVTSRLPVVNFVSHSTYREHVVGALSAKEGQDLLERLGVHGSEAQLGSLVRAWNGHPLTLRLLAGYLVEVAAGEAARASDLSCPSPEKTLPAVFRELLESYDRHLNPAERALLGVCSLFRLPVPTGAFEAVSASPLPQRRRARGKRRSLEGRSIAFIHPLRDLDGPALEALAESLAAQQLMGRDEAGDWVLHPLVRAHYHETIGEQQGDREALHRLIAADYKTMVRPRSSPPLLQDLTPWTEAVHHLAEARAWDEALQILWGVLLADKEFLLTKILGAYEAALDTYKEFFAGRDVTRECLVPRRTKRWRLKRETAFTLFTLGRATEALGLYEGLVNADRNSRDWTSAALVHQDLCRLMAVLGRLAEAEGAAKTSLEIARHSRQRAMARNALVLRAWVRVLRGNASGAASDIEAAVEAARGMHGKGPVLEGLRGAVYAEHLRRLGRLGEARAVALENLEVAEKKGHLYDQSRFNRILGELEAAAGDPRQALARMSAAVNQARGTSDRLTLLEALISRGAVLAQTRDFAAARADLNDAVTWAQKSGFLLPEIDARLTLARLLQAEGRMEAADAETAWAHARSLEIGYAIAVQQA